MEASEAPARVGAFLAPYPSSSYKMYYVNYSLGKTVENSVFPTAVNVLAVPQVLAN